MPVVHNCNFIKFKESQFQVPITNPLKAIVACPPPPLQPFPFLPFIIFHENVITVYSGV